LSVMNSPNQNVCITIAHNQRSAACGWNCKFVTKHLPQLDWRLSFSSSRNPIYHPVIN
jgi:hypothetical protein